MMEKAEYPNYKKDSSESEDKISEVSHVMSRHDGKFQTLEHCNVHRRQVISYFTKSNETFLPTNADRFILADVLNIVVERSR